MNNHPIEVLMETAMNSIKEMVDVNTIIGDPIETKNGMVIIPISKVCFGFAAGGSEFGNHTSLRKEEEKYPFGGGSGAGVSVKPIAFLIVKDGMVRLQPVDYDNTVDRLVDSIPQVIELVKGFFNDKKVDNNDNL